MCAGVRPVGGQTSSRRCEESARAFQSGQSIDQMAARWTIKRDAVINHLWEYLRDGGRLDGGRLLDACRLTDADRNRALETLKRLGCRSLSPVFQELGGTVPYPELRLLGIYLSCTGSCSGREGL